ncbi:MAG: N(G),N(G)-dimethylarginine dimethylaminohydrolase [Halieaceae bacterium]|jgi:dimethylargininase|nr:N(G),N(G)-dimethylarginine dimethylaminohydrolase [Halieaceae bacterium]
MEVQPLTFSKAIVRTPSESMVDGLTTAGLGAPDYGKALDQHRLYIEALKTCGLEVIVLPKDERFPDATFVEDTALVTPHCAIITNPGAPSRTAETGIIRETIAGLFDHTESIEGPGTVEAGDIMMVGSHFYIGRSERTNENGIQQMIGLLEQYGMTGSSVTMKEVLHLKTGLSYLENNNLIICGEFLTAPEFRQFNHLTIEPQESYAANSVWINSTVLVPAGYPKARALIEQAGYQTIALDVSEFRKIDGGLSCLSLRW